MTCAACGTVNTPDSQFCTHCGVALQPRVQGGEEAARPIRAIAGQPEHPSFRAFLWEQLTSIKLAIALIVVIVLLSMIGTLIPQGEDPLFYLANYGEVGASIIRALLLDQIYHSWYFVSLLVLLAINTGACAIRRFRVSWELVRKPVEARTAEEIARLPTQTQLDVRLFAQLEEILKRRRYRVRREGPQLVAYKNLWGRLGIDILHASLIIVLIGGIIGGLLGFESFHVAHEGETFSVPQGNFQVRVDALRVEHYPDSAQVKDWYTTLTVIENGQEILTKTIEVNEPLTYKGISFYQASFGSDWLGGAELTFRVERVEESSAELIGEFTAKVGTAFSLEDGRTVKVVAFYPDFIVTEQGPVNRSLALNNPAAFLEVYDGDHKEFATWTFARFPGFQHDFLKETPYRFYLVGMKAPEFTGLQIARNPGIPVIYAGFILLVFGLVLNFYLPPRRIWAAAKENTLYVGGLGREPREFESEFEEIIMALTPRLCLDRALSPAQAGEDEAHAQRAAGGVRASHEEVRHG